MPVQNLKLGRETHANFESMGLYYSIFTPAYVWQGELEEMYPAKGSALDVSFGKDGTVKKAQPLNSSVYLPENADNGKPKWAVVNGGMVGEGVDYTFGMKIWGMVNDQKATMPVHYFPKGFTLSSHSGLDIDPPYRGLTLFSSKTHDVVWDVRPSRVYKNQKELSLPFVSANPRWYRRAGMQEVKSEEFGSRRFFVATDLMGRFYVYPDNAKKINVLLEENVDPMSVVTWDFPFVSNGLQPPDVASFYQLSYSGRSLTSVSGGDATTLSMGIPPSEYTQNFFVLFFAGFCGASTPGTLGVGFGSYQGEYAATYIPAEYDLLKGYESGWDDPRKMITSAQYLWTFNYNSTKATTVAYRYDGDFTIKGADGTQHHIQVVKNESVGFPHMIKGAVQSGQKAGTITFSKYRPMGDEAFHLQKPLYPCVLQVIIKISITGRNPEDFSVSFSSELVLDSKTDNVWFLSSGYTSPEFDKKKQIVGGDELNAFFIVCHGDTSDFSAEEMFSSYKLKPEVKLTDSDKEELLGGLPAGAETFVNKILATEKPSLDEISGFIGYSDLKDARKWFMYHATNWYLSVTYNQAKTIVDGEAASVSALATADYLKHTSGATYHTDATELFYHLGGSASLMYKTDSQDPEFSWDISNDKNVAALLEEMFNDPTKFKHKRACYKGAAEVPFVIKKNDETLYTTDDYYVLVSQTLIHGYEDNYDAPNFDFKSALANQEVKEDFTAFCRATGATLMSNVGTAENSAVYGTHSMQLSEEFNKAFHQFLADAYNPPVSGQYHLILNYMGTLFFGIAPKIFYDKYKTIWGSVCSSANGDLPLKSWDENKTEDQPCKGITVLGSSAILRGIMGEPSEQGRVGMICDWDESVGTSSEDDPTTVELTLTEGTWAPPIHEFFVLCVYPLKIAMDFVRAKLTSNTTKDAESSTTKTYSMMESLCRAFTGNNSHMVASMMRADFYFMPLMAEFYLEKFFIEFGWDTNAPTLCDLNRSLLYQIYTNSDTTFDFTPASKDTYKAKFNAMLKKITFTVVDGYLHCNMASRFYPYATDQSFTDSDSVNLHRMRLNDWVYKIPGASRIYPYMFIGEGTVVLSNKIHKFSVSCGFLNNGSSYTLGSSEYLLPVRYNGVAHGMPKVPTTGTDYLSSYSAVPCGTLNASWENNTCSGVVDTEKVSYFSSKIYAIGGDLYTNAYTMYSEFPKDFSTNNLTFANTVFLDYALKSSDSIVLTTVQVVDCSTNSVAFKSSKGGANSADYSHNVALVVNDAEIKNTGISFDNSESEAALPVDECNMIYQWVATKYIASDFGHPLPSVTGSKSWNTATNSSVKYDGYLDFKKVGFSSFPITSNNLYTQFSFIHSSVVGAISASILPIFGTYYTLKELKNAGYISVSLDSYLNPALIIDFVCSVPKSQRYKGLAGLGVDGIVTSHLELFNRAFNQKVEPAYYVSPTTFPGAFGSTPGSSGVWYEYSLKAVDPRDEDV